MSVRNGVEQVCEDHSSDEATCYVSRRGLSRERRAAGRIGTKRGRDIDPDWNWNPSVLTSSRSQHVRLARTIHTQTGIQSPMTIGKPHPTR